MNIFLWLLQALLAAQCLFHSRFFLFPPPQFVVLLNEAFPLWFRLFLGVAEPLAGIGLILPRVTRIMPWLTPLAAAGIMIVTVSASVLHFSRSEVSSALTTVALFLIATFVAYMRWQVKPLPARKSARYA